MFPLYPGPFDLPGKGTEAQINARHDVWKDVITNSIYAKQLKGSHLKWSAIEPQCLAHTSCYGDNIVAVEQHPFTIYGHIYPQQLKAQEMEICNTNFHIPLRVDTIFNAFNNLLELTEYALMSMSSNQAVSLAYILFLKNPVIISTMSTPTS